MNPNHLNFEASEQLSFAIEKPFEKDRNFSQGGRSFYFFDFDENIAHLNTATVIFNKKTQQEKFLTGKEFAMFHHQIGVKGPYKDFNIQYDDRTGSFRNYRDQKISRLAKLFGKKQKFISDMSLTLTQSKSLWQGPSWSCFYHAVYNKRPIALITARGHSPQTIKEGILELVKAGHLPHEPNYLGIYPVNFPPLKEELLASSSFIDVSQLKKIAIKKAFKKAIETYGDKPHRFGMSDDDKDNIRLITEAMKELKMDFPQISFFVIETSEGRFIKKEITVEKSTNTHLIQEQLNLPINSPEMR